MAASQSEDGEKPGLNDLLGALDQVIKQEYHKPSNEIRNTVYRKLIKTEKKKAYNSILSIQTQIFDL